MGKGTVQEWAVYEHAAGRVWAVTPATEEHARDAAEHFNVPDGYTSHEAMPRERAEALANAFSHGRVSAVQQEVLPPVAPAGSAADAVLKAWRPLPERSDSAWHQACKMDVRGAMTNLAEALDRLDHDTKEAVVRIYGVNLDDPERAHATVDEVLLSLAPLEVRDAVQAVQERSPWWAGA